MTVRAGQIVHISGWVRATSPTVGSLDGAMIYDSLHGAAGGLRWHEAGGWQRFQMIREITQSGPFTLTFVLNGLGELQLDELRVVPHNPRPESNPSDKPPEPATPPTPRPSALQFLNHLPKLNPLAPRE